MVSVCGGGWRPASNTPKRVSHPLSRGIRWTMTAEERAPLGPDDQEVDERTVGQEVASGRPETTPFTLLGSVVAVIAVVFTIVLAIVVLVVLLV